MNITIKYNDIINRCEMLSAFEAKDKFDANGQSRFLEIHINEVDKQLIQQYIIQARSILEERMERMIVSTNDSFEEEKKETVTLLAKPFTPVTGDGGVLGKYNRVDTPVSGLPDGGTIVLIDGWSVFGLAIQTSMAPSYDVYTDVSAVGKDYIYEEGKTKVYCTLPNNGNAYTWNASGDGLKEYFGDYTDTITHIIRHEGISMDIRTDTRWKGHSAFIKHITEALVSYAMAQWLRGKLDDRVSFYENLFNNTLAMAVKNIFTKQAPVK